MSAAAKSSIPKTWSYFTYLTTSEMPEDDTVVLSNRWSDFEAMFTEEISDFLVS